MSQSSSPFAKFKKDKPRQDAALVSFEPEADSGPSQKAQRKASNDAVSPTSACSGDFSEGALVPRKSVLLHDVLRQKPMAYTPKYVVERKSLPPERWVKTVSNPKWSPIPNSRACVPPLTLSEYESELRARERQVPDVDDDANDANNDIDDSPFGEFGMEESVRVGEDVHFEARLPSTKVAAARKKVMLSTTEPLFPPAAIEDKGKARHGEGKAGSPGKLHAAGSPVGFLRGSPTKGEIARQRLAQTTIEAYSTPIANGVQQAWESSFVQLGPFRTLRIFHHEATAQEAVPIELLPPENVRLTPLEKHRVEWTQNHNTRARTPDVCKGHVSPQLARSTHIGLCSPSGLPRSPPPSQSTPSRGSANSPHGLDLGQTSPSPSRGAAGRGGGSIADSFTSASTIPSAGLPAMHFALPPGPVLPLPAPVKVPPQLPKRFKPTEKYCGLCHAAAQGVVCPHCNEVREELDSFDEVRESKEERLYQLQLQKWQEEQAREEEAKNIPPDMMRTKSGRLVKRLIIMDEGPTVAQLYHGTTHQDREALYVATCGGLSFDITKERFAHLVGKVLAPRIHVRMSDDQINAMFALFDLDGNGSVSYFEYLATLSNQLLAPRQRKFLEDLFQALYKLPFASNDAKTANKLFQQHQAELQLNIGHNATNAPGSPLKSDDDPSPPSSPLKRAISSVALRKKSLRKLSMSDSLFQDDDVKGLTTKGQQRKQAVVVPTTYLASRHFTVQRLKHIIYELNQHNPWFPHPKDDALAVAIVTCFQDLVDEDRVNIHKFKMFIFCDDGCMPALEDVVPEDVT